METRKFRVYNRTRESFLGTQVILADASEEHVDRLIENLAFQAGEGLWLKPWRELPTECVLPLFDLIYLNEESSVIQVVELYPGLAAEPLTTQAASALVLPVGSILASQTQPGDHLAIYPPQQVERIPEASPSETAPDLGAQDKEVSAPSPRDERSRQLQLAIRQLNEQEAAAAAAASSPKKESLKTRFLRWLDADRKPAKPVDRRQARRNPLPGLVAFYWTGGAPHPFHIGNISESGVYLLTNDRSSPGTIFMLTLQRTDSDGEHLGDAISIYAEVVRWGADGVGLEFIPSKPVGHGAGHTLPGNPADEDTLLDFLDRLNLPPSESQR